MRYRALVILLAFVPLSCGDEDDNLPCLSEAAVTCGVGACQRTVPACVAGIAETCVPGDPELETCNGIDDDCNGLVDDDAPTTCGVGACVAPAVCSEGVETCTPLAASVEVCNGIDDDCDGEPDEGSISCGVGACAVTVAACAAGADNVCVPAAPGVEVCNGIDDNCDGVTDEGTITCGNNTCAVTVLACANGVDNVCVPGAPGVEVCNGLDDDCDLVVDNNAAATTRYVPLTVTGFNQDIVAEGFPATSTTTAAVDGSDYALYSRAYGDAASSGNGLPNDGIVARGIYTFQLASYSGNNALMLLPTQTGSLTIDTPTPGVGLALIGFSTEGSVTFTYDLHRADGSTSSHSGAFSDWFSGSNAVYSGFDRTGRGTGSPDYLFSEPRMHATTIDYDCLASPVTSVDIRDVASTGSGRVVLMAVALGL